MKPQKLIHFISGFILITPVLVYAVDIKPLHHGMLAGNAINWPKPTGEGSPTGAGYSLNPAHGGSGILAAGATKDQLRFYCPAGTNSIELNLREKSANTSTNVRAGYLPGPTLTLSDNIGGDFAFAWLSIKNMPGGSVIWDIQIDKIGGTAALQYELGVSCFSGTNETGVMSQPSGAVYLLNQ